MLHIGICDDDIHMLNYLTQLCARILPGSGIHTHTNGHDLLERAVQYDILLMDIKMEQMDGIQVVKQLHFQSSHGIPRRPAVIFITAYEEYVFDALDLFTFHYLLKPLDEEKFERVLKLAATEYVDPSEEEALFFHTKSSHLRLKPSQITFVESNLRKAVIHTEHEQFEIYSTMSKLQELLGSHFYRCHRGYLVNLDKIKGYDRQNIWLVDGNSLLLSKPKYPEFVDTYMRFLKRSESGSQ